MRNSGVFLLSAILAACAATPRFVPGATATADATARAAEERARRTLAANLNLSLEAVTVVSSEPVEWPDASLGCPEPGMAYAQVITPGYRVTLMAEGQTYSVHTDLESQAVVCTEPVDPLDAEFPVTPGSIDDGQPWIPAY